MQLPSICQEQLLQWLQIFLLIISATTRITLIELIDQELVVLLYLWNLRYIKELSKIYKWFLLMVLVRHIAKTWSHGRKLVDKCIVLNQTFRQRKDALIITRLIVEYVVCCMIDEHRIVMRLVLLLSVRG